MTETLIQPLQTKVIKHKKEELKKKINILHVKKACGEGKIMNILKLTQYWTKRFLLKSFNSPLQNCFKNHKQQFSLKLKNPNLKFGRITHSV